MEKEYYEKNKKKILEKRRIYYIENKKKILEKRKLYRKEHPEVAISWEEKNPEYKKEWYQKNKEKCLKQSREYYKNNKEEHSQYCKEYNIKNKDKNSERGKDYYLKNKKKILYRTWKYYKNNKEKMDRYRKTWREDNIEKVREQNKKRQGYHNQYKRKKRKTNPKFKLDGNIGWMIWQGLKENKKGRSWFNLLPYNREELVEHLEKQFTPEMNWSNYGNYWVVDHIIPRSSFDYNNPEDINFQKCWALENLRPLTKEENLKKGAKIVNIPK